MSATIDDLLIQAQKKEIEIFSINLTELAREFRQEPVLLYPGARFIAGLSHLIYLKAKHLVPEDEPEIDEEIDGNSAPLSDEQLEEYRAFKEVAHTFSRKEREQGMHFMRPQIAVPEKTVVRQLHLPVDLEEFSRLFLQIWQQASSRTFFIHEEEWTVAEGLKIVRQKLLAKRVSLAELFPLEYSKEQLIVTFLAILELLKNQEAALIKETDNWFLIAP